MSRRIRTIKPGLLLEDERAMALSDAAWRLWVGVRMLADDFGTFRAGDRYLAAQIWHETSRAKRMPALIAELVSHRLIAMFEADGSPFGAILTWPTEQRVDDQSERTALPMPPQSIQSVIDDLAATIGKSPRVSGSRGGIRKVAARARPRASSPPEGDPDTDLETEREGDPDPPRVREREPEVYVVPRCYAVAFARGIETATANPIAAPTSSGDLARFTAAIDAHARDDTGKRLEGADQIVPWVTASAEAFARAPREAGRGFTGFPVWAWVAWLDGGRGAVSGVRRGVQPPAPGGGSWVKDRLVSKGGT